MTISDISGTHNRIFHRCWGNSSSTRRTSSFNHITPHSGETIQRSCVKTCSHPAYFEKISHRGGGEILIDSSYSRTDKAAVFLTAVDAASPEPTDVPKLLLLILGKITFEPLGAVNFFNASF